MLIGRAHFAFSDFDYCETEIPVAQPPQVLTIRADALQIIRPEGDWGQPGRPEAGDNETG